MNARPPEQRKNGYEDADFKTVISEIEEMHEEIESVMASARGRVSGIKTRIKNRIKIADKQLQIPPDVLRAVLSQRKLERQIENLAESVPDDLIEVFEDAAGQFSLFKPDDGEDAKPAAQAAAEKRKADIQKVTDEEQAQGAAALDELAGGEAAH